MACDQNGKHISSVTRQYIRFAAVGLDKATDMGAPQKQGVQAQPSTRSLQQCSCAGLFEYEQRETTQNYAQTRSAILKLI